MKRRVLFLGSIPPLRDQPVVVALWATRRARVKHISAALSTGKRLQQVPLANVKYTSARLGLSITILMACFAHPTSAVTLQTVLQTTLEKNPAIQEAKSGLEQAAGQRLVLRSIVWPNVELGVPAGIQGELVVGEDIGAFLRLREVIENDHRHLGQANASGGEQASVSGQDSGSGVDQNRVGEAKFANTAGDLLDLLF